MRETCPCCGLRFDRGEPGYFTGAMYVSYALGIPLIALLTLAEYLILPGRWTLLGLVSLAWLISLPAVPLIWQYSRLIFMNFDQWADPTEPTKLLPGECPTDPGEDAGGVDDR